MYKVKVFSVIMGIVFVLLFAKGITVNANEEETEKEADGFFYTVGTQIYDGYGNEFQIKAMNLKNGIADYNTPSLPIKTSTTEKTYKEMKQMGFNTARFLINYQILEDDENPFVYKETGWEWLDQNVYWARKYDIKLIINMHIPQGGYQSNGMGMALWNDQNQKRLIALWKAIAQRYSQENIIIGYGLVNEPQVQRKEDLYLWEQLANKIVTSIKAVDNVHLCFVEACGVYGGEGYLFPKIKYDNIVYECHVYPFNKIDWYRNSTKNNGIEYGNDNILFINSNNMVETKEEKKVLTTVTNNKWQTVSTIITAPEKTNNAYLRISVGNLGNKTVQIRNIKVYEYSENNNFNRIVYDSNNNLGILYNSWSSTGFKESKLNYIPDYENHTITFEIKNETGNIDFADNSIFRYFRVTPGYKYVILYDINSANYNTGDMFVNVALNFGYSQDMYSLDNSFLENILDVKKMEKELQAPVFIGEIGIERSRFESEKQGYALCEDMLNIVMDNHTNFSYFAYHDPVYGLYSSSYKEVKNLNSRLKEMFTKINK